MSAWPHGEDQTIVMQSFESYKKGLAHWRYSEGH